MDGVIKKDFSFTECQLLTNILFNSNEKYLTQSSLSRKCEIAVTSPTFVKVFKYLVENAIITQHQTIGSSKLLEIFPKKLRDLIDEQYITEFWFNYFKNYHFVAW